MDLSSYVDDLQRQLAVAAAHGSEDAQVAAQHLTVALEAATRVVLLDVLAAATGEITRDLAPGSVDLRLRGREVEFVVDLAHGAGESDEQTAAALDPEDVSTSRTTLRLPDALKVRVDEAAAADGLSVNTWLVRAVSAALQPKQRRPVQRTPRTGDSFAGWAR